MRGGLSPISAKPPSWKEDAMQRDTNEHMRDRTPAPRADDDWDLNDLLHPAQAFAHPSDVVNDPDLTLNEKRAILASWASDACAIEAAPGLRHVDGCKRPIAFDEIMEALRALDKRMTADQRENNARYRRTIRRNRFRWRRDGGTPAN